ncbi:MAG: hypothetical protein LBJ12_02385 [Oscillospiraceae bacterium]|nr:hypothetical protein [Oscillospiraceae bacterium]
MSAKNIHNFQKLTPVDDAELGIYSDALDFIFSEQDLRNIAVSGAYSAGKSSVIASYKKSHPSTQFLHISLAHFEGSQEVVTAMTGQEKPIKESVLEGKILNQLIHQITPENIPQTNFRVKQRVSKPKSLFEVFVAAVMLGVYSFLFDKWSGFVNGLSSPWIKNILYFSISDFSRIAGLILLAAAIIYMIFRLYHIFKYKTIFKKLSVQGNEIEIFEQSEESYFDKYLNEVLYLFERSGVDVIVFEDMDRFNAVSIFERLREVNTLINEQRQKQYDRVSKLFIRRTREYKPLRFFYLLRDDIFTSTKDRTKFFDYILPVVPIIDGSNSYDKFIEVLKKGKIFGRFDEHFLKSLSLYIDDMRVLLNIYNEFKVYITRIGTTDQDWNKMLAIITYKNLFPRDFSELQLGRGYVASLFDRKPDFVDDKKADYEVEIEKKKKVLSTINAEHMQSVEEAHQYFASKDILQWGNYVNRENFAQHRYYYSKFKEELDKRLDLITAKKDGKVYKLESEIKILKEKIKELQSLTISAIIESGSTRSVFNEQEAQKYFSTENMYYFDLLIYLLRSGMIDESYHDYMTYFYPNSITEQDKKYLRGIHDRKPKPFNYPLDNPQLVLTYLSKDMMKDTQTLNFTLMSYLLKSENDGAYLDLFFALIVDEKNYHYILSAILWGIKDNAFINKVNQVWPEFISDISANCNGKISQKENTGIRILNEVLPRENQAVAIDNFVLLTLYFTSNAELKAANIDECITAYIQDNPEFLEFGQHYKGERSDEPNRDRLLDRFCFLDVKFKTLNYEKSDSELFDGVYKKCLYEINSSNITLMLRVTYDLGNTEFYHNNLTLIMAQPDSPLAKYIWKNIDIYMGIYLDMAAGEISDDEAVAISVLNSGEITNDHKASYISALNSTIQHISTVEDKSLWAQLLEEDKVPCNVENIVQYFLDSKKVFDDTLIDFINRHAGTIDFSTTAVIFDDKIAESLFDAAIICNSLSNQVYKDILAGLDFCYEEGFSISGICADKFSILVDINTIHMHEDALVFIRKNYSKSLLVFIEKHVEEYVEIMTEGLFDVDEALNVLDLNISDDLKIRLLEFTEEPIKILPKSYSVAVKTQILKNNFDMSELIGLVLQYPQEATDVQKCIENIVVDNIAKVLGDFTGEFPIALFDVYMREFLYSFKLTDGFHLIKKMSVTAT